MGVKVSKVTVEDAEFLIARHEGHFLDMKDQRIAPSKLTRSIAAFANADGGELLIGVQEGKPGRFAWSGFSRPEDANAHLQVFEQLFPLGGDFDYEFLELDGKGGTGFVLRASIAKTRDIKKASDGIIYLRRGAQNLQVTTDDAVLNLRRAKGVISHEDATVQTGLDTITNSVQVIEFMLNVVPHSEPEPWLRKQHLVIDGKPTVAGVMLFADEPQVVLPKGAVKLYRYKTVNAEGTRETLAFDPIAVEGSIYNQIQQAVEKTVGLTEKIQIMTSSGLQPIQYPKESLHEIITNAVLHRDYAHNDDVHVRIFDNRVEVESRSSISSLIRPTRMLAKVSTLHFRR